MRIEAMPCGNPYETLLCCYSNGSATLTCCYGNLYATLPCSYGNPYATLPCYCYSNGLMILQPCRVVMVTLTQPCRAAMVTLMQPCRIAMVTLKANSPCSYGNAYATLPWCYMVTFIQPCPVAMHGNSCATPSCCYGNPYNPALGYPPCYYISHWSTPPCDSCYKKTMSTVQGWEWVRTLYQSEDPNPTQPTRGRKKKRNRRRQKVRADYARDTEISVRGLMRCIIDWSFRCLTEKVLSPKCL